MDTPQAASRFYSACGTPIHPEAEVCPGGFGIHRFDPGRIGLGILYLLFCWTLIPSIVAFIEFILLLVMSDGKFNQKYGKS